MNKINIERKNKKILLIILFASIIWIFLSSNVYALGVTPGRTTIDYAPGSEREVAFTVINSEHKELDLAVFVQGDLNRSIVLDENFIHMSSSEEEKKISVKLKMPIELAPGRHSMDVVIAEVPKKQIESEKTIVGATLAVATQIVINAHYQGKYLESEFKVSGTEKKKKFSIQLNSIGTEAIDKAGAVISIYDFSGEHIKTLNTNEISLQAYEKKEIFADWNVDASEGRYTAKVVLNYDGKEMFLEKEFEVGEFLLDLQQIFVKDFRLGDIAKFNMLVKNKWNEPIANAYAEMRVYDSEMDEIVNIKSATYSIPAGMQTTMNYYWDTKDVEEGLYNANVILHYAEKKTQQDLKLDVGQNRIEIIGLGYVISSESTSRGGKGIVTILIVVIALLILINLAWFFAWRKKIKKDK